LELDVDGRLQVEIAPIDIRLERRRHGPVTVANENMMLEVLMWRLVDRSESDDRRLAVRLALIFGESRRDCDDASPDSLAFVASEGLRSDTD